VTKYVSADIAGATVTFAAPGSGLFGDPSDQNPSPARSSDDDSPQGPDQVDGLPFLHEVVSVQGVGDGLHGRESVVYEGSPVSLLNARSTQGGLLDQYSQEAQTSSEAEHRSDVQSALTSPILWNPISPLYQPSTVWPVSSQAEARLFVHYIQHIAPQVQESCPLDKRIKH